MPLSYYKPKFKHKIGPKMGRAFLKSIEFIRPQTILGVFLTAALVLAFLRITAIGFYAVFGIFIIGYFAERISKNARNKANRKK